MRVCRLLKNVRRSSLPVSVSTVSLLLTLCSQVAYAENSSKVLQRKIEYSAYARMKDGNAAPLEPGIKPLAIWKHVRLWTDNNNVIPICWFTPGYAREKSIIRNAIARTWQRVANLTFTWRDNCPTMGEDQFVKIQIGRHTAVTDDNGKVILDSKGNPVFDHSTDGQTRGRGMDTLSSPSEVPSGPFSGNGVTIWVEDSNGSVVPRMEYVAVHEFGHVLGFEHEQDRAESEARACTASAGSDVVGIGPYDPDSIMNYCTSTGNSHGLLTEGDVMGVRALYGFAPATGTFFADLNGDHKADVIAVNHGGNYILLSNGAQFDSWKEISPAFLGTRETLFGDVNGDGKVDAIAINNKANWVMLSNGSTLVWAGKWSDPFNGSRRTLAADVNGDGKADLIAVNNKATFVMTSDGTNFTNWGQWTMAPFYGTIGTFAVDVDGDGKADLIAVKGDGIYVAISNGKEFLDKGKWTKEDFKGYVETYMSDVNGDGKADAIAVDDDRIYVALSTGTSFEKGRAWTASPFVGSIVTPMADVTGDGKSDAIAVNYKANWVMTSNGSSFDWSGKWSGPFYGGN